MTDLIRMLFRIFASLAAVLVSITSATAATQVLSDDFTGASASLAWKVYGSACMTAGSGSGTIPACASGSAGGDTGPVPDGSGNGTLQLTRAITNDVGGIVSLNSFASSAGFSVTFKAISYGGTGADGISFFLLDATRGVPSSLGHFGGGLGYAGIAGGYMGIGLDEYGNFANPGCGGGGCSGGPGFNPNVVAVRGPTTSANPFLTMASPGFALWSNVSTRQQATAHTYKITMTSSGLISVSIDGVTYVSSLDATANAGPIPAYLRVGIAASTGGTTNFHQIYNFSVSSLSSSNIVVSKTSTVISDPINGTNAAKLIPGATLRYCVIVANLQGNPTANGITIADQLGPLPLTFVPGSIRLNGTASNGTCLWNGSPGGSFSAATVSGTLADLAGGATSTLYFDTVLK